MLWEHLEILLTPRLLVLQSISNIKRRPGSIAARREPVDQTQTSTDWRAAVKTLGAALPGAARRGSRIDIAVSDVWVRSHLMPVAATGLSESETLLLARTHFARQYPETGQDAWTFRLALQGPRILAAGVESTLLTAVTEITANAGFQLKRVEPLFSWVYDRYAKELADTSGWVLLDEPGMLVLALIEKGQLTNLHWQRCENDQDETAVQLLQRQSALLAHRSVEVHAFSVGARAIRLPAPWHIVWQRGIFEFGESPQLAGAAAPPSRQR